MAIFIYLITMTENNIDVQELSTIQPKTVVEIIFCFVLHILNLQSTVIVRIIGKRYLIKRRYGLSIVDVFTVLYRSLEMNSSFLVITSLDFILHI